MAQRLFDDPLTPLLLHLYIQAASQLQPAMHAPLLASQMQGCLYYILQACTHNLWLAAWLLGVRCGRQCRLVNELALPTFEPP